MNIEKNTLRTRAANLFAAEQRTQELVGLALLQQQGNFQTLDAKMANTSADKRNFDDLLADSDQNILNAHQKLQHARSYAAQLQAEDKQLNELNQLIYGSWQTGLAEDVIEGEIVEEVIATKTE